MASVRLFSDEFYVAGKRSFNWECGEKLISFFGRREILGTDRSTSQLSVYILGRNIMCFYDNGLSVRWLFLLRKRD